MSEEDDKTRLVRVEATLTHMSADLGEIKAESKEIRTEVKQLFTQVLQLFTDLTKSFVTHHEFDEQKEEVNTRLNDHNKEIKTLQDNQHKRPTWSISITITSLVAICTALTVYILTGHPGA